MKNNVHIDGPLVMVLTPPAARPEVLLQQCRRAMGLGCRSWIAQGVNECEVTVSRILILSLYLWCRTENRSRSASFNKYTDAESTHVFGHGGPISI
jgi:hypothetical protein